LAFIAQNRIVAGNRFSGLRDSLGEAMDLKQAEEVANLLNGRNELVQQYRPQTVYAARENYLLEFSSEDSVIGCAELKKVQWYQYEISHVSVKKEVEGTGIGWKLLKQAEQMAIQGGGRIIQCTIRANNKCSQEMFARNGYSKASEFYYPVSGNMVEVWQKPVSRKP
jgi:ribosomal protein S18 acetylase RimI-like enzyme